MKITRIIWSALLTAVLTTAVAVRLNAQTPAPPAEGMSPENPKPVGAPAEMPDIDELPAAGDAAAAIDDPKEVLDGDTDRADGTPAVAAAPGAPGEKLEALEDELADGAEAKKRAAEAKKAEGEKIEGSPLNNLTAAGEAVGGGAKKFGEGLAPLVGGALALGSGLLLGLGNLGLAALGAVGAGLGYLYKKGDKPAVAGAIGGGVVGLLVGGPVGGLVGAAVGGLIGHFFGGD